MRGCQSLTGGQESNVAERHSLGRLGADMGRYRSKDAFLELGDITPDYRRYADMSGTVVYILLERKDVCTAVPDHQNKTPLSLSLALSERHDGVMRILLQRVNSNCVVANRDCQSSLPATEPA